MASVRSTVIEADVAGVTSVDAAVVEPLEVIVVMAEGVDEDIAVTVVEMAVSVDVLGVEGSVVIEVATVVATRLRQRADEIGRTSCPCYTRTLPDEGWLVQRCSIISRAGLLSVEHEAKGFLLCNQCS